MMFSSSIKGTPFVWTQFAIFQSPRCESHISSVVVCQVAPFPVMVSISQKEAVKRETNAEPAPRTAKRYYC